jgi:hypothetical protein
LLGWKRGGRRREEEEGKEKEKKRKADRWVHEQCTFIFSRFNSKPNL